MLFVSRQRWPRLSHGLYQLALAGGVTVDMLPYARMDYDHLASLDLILLVKRYVKVLKHISLFAFTVHFCLSLFLHHELGLSFRNSG